MGKQDKSTFTGKGDTYIQKESEKIGSFHTRLMSECVPLHEANLKRPGKVAGFSNALLSIKYYMTYKEDYVTH